MKKSLLVLASIMILALCTFVACTAEVSDPYDGLTYVTFGGESPASRNLLASYEVASYDKLYWFYTAEKKDNYGTSGAASNAPVRKDGESGLDGTVGPFSQGKWLFTLCAYKDNAVNENAKVYEGSVEVSLKGQKVTVPVSVTPYGETGALKFSEAYFAWKDNGKDAPVIEIVAKGTKTGQKYTLGNKIANDNTNPEDAKIKLDITSAGDNKTYRITDCEYSTVKADYYNCTIIAYIDDPKTPIFSQTLGFRVYGSATTVIRGDITEQSGTDVDFDPAKQDMAVFKGATTASVKVTPSGTEDTTVDFGKNNLDNTSTYYLNVAATSVASAANKFTVADSSKAPVAGIDLELVEVSSAGINTKVTKFKGDSVTVTTYIEKGLTGVKIYYDGAVCDDNPTYTPEDGKLVFKTNHFSEFYAVSDSVVVDETTGKGYARFVDAFDNSVDGSSIKLLKDVVVDDLIDISRKTIVFDLAGKKVTIGSTVEREGGIIRVLGGGDLTINDSVGGGEIDTTSNRKMKNNSVHPSYNGSEPAVWTCIDVFPEIDDANHLVNGNARLTINGGTFKAHYYAIAGNGQCKDENSTIVTIDGGSFATLDGSTFYHPQNGVLVIKDGTFNGNDTAIEIRAGKLEIYGGSFSSEKEPSAFNSNGNGTTSQGSAIAVAQHNTKLPIDVEISGGTFSGYHALSVVNPQNNEYNAISKINVNVTGGEFTSTKKGVEVVNCSSEFIKIDNGSTFTIRARKDGDEGNITCLPDGRFFSSLQGAVDGVKDGSTVSLTLLSNVENGDGLLIKEGRNLDLTIDFNSNDYWVVNSVASEKVYSSPYAEAFLLKEGNKVTLKNGILKNAKADIVLIRSFCNLKLEDIALDCSVKEAKSVLFCSYGTTSIAGSTRIENKFSTDKYTAVHILWLPSTGYSAGACVEFNEDFSGSVVGTIRLGLEREAQFDGTAYTHSLIINDSEGDFSNATFILDRVGNSSLFEVSSKTVRKELSFRGNHYPVIEVAGCWVLYKDSAVVHNKTTDAIYEELSRSMSDTTDEFENELELMREECVLKYSIPQPNGKTIILDLKGCKIKADSTLKSSTGMFAVGSKGKLIIRDSSDNKGSIDSSNNANVPYCMYVDSRGRLEIDSGITIKAAEGKIAATGCSSEIITDGYTYPSN